MAITLINIDQDNKDGVSDLLPAHSKLVFLIDVEYTGAAPDRLDVEIYDTDDTLLETYNAIPFDDLLGTPATRQFAFVADGIVRGLMEEFDDTFQLFDTLVSIPEMTTRLRLKFIDPDNASMYDEGTYTFVHGARQFGENPNLKDQYDNDSDVYYAVKDGVVYVYFYNNNENNTLVIGSNVVEVFALDFDDASIFTDYEDTNFTIDVPE
jgi:hypothetical protein